MNKFHSSVHKNRPLHLYLDENIYFITARTINKKYYLENSNKKRLFLIKLNEILEKFSIICYAYIILNNHYHLLVKFPKGDKVPKFINRLHSIVSLHLNRLDNTPKRQIWYQYWDRCPRSENDFYAWFNYIHLNPIKHKLLKFNKEIFFTKNKNLFISEENIDQLIKLLKQYKYSSFNSIIKTKGENWIRDIWMNNSIPLDYWKLED